LAGSYQKADERGKKATYAVPEGDLKSTRVKRHEVPSGGKKAGSNLLERIAR